MNAGLMRCEWLWCAMKFDSRNDLISPLMPVVKAIAKSMAGHEESRQDAADFAAMVGLTRALAKWNPAKGEWPAFAKSYVRECIKNALVDYDRAPPNGPDCEYLPSPEHWEPVAKKRPEDDPEFRDAVAALPIELRQPVDLVALEGRSLRSAGRILEISDKTVKARLATAYERLNGKVKIDSAKPAKSRH